MNEIVPMFHVKLSDKQIEQFDMYYKLLVEWNEKINLTSITDYKEVWIKHFLDSCSLAQFIEPDEMKEKTMIDVGTGGGFPGIPLAIIYPELQVTLMDSLNKRINFLDCVIQELGLDNVVTVHSRAEDGGKNADYREQFDYAVSRAVANLSVLSEYCTPFVKVKGEFIAYKSVKASEELTQAEHAFTELNCYVDRKEKFNLDEDMERTIFFIKKEDNTPSKYPRKAGVPTKRPL